MTHRKDPSSSDHARQLLIGHIRARRALRDDRKAINDQLREQAREIRDQGFDPRRVDDVVRWMEECDKHGREVVDEAEALFELYRDVAAGGGKRLSEMMDDARDRALLKQFAGDGAAEPKAPTRKEAAASDALASAAMSRMLRGGR